MHKFAHLVTKHQARRWVNFAKSLHRLTSQTAQKPDYAIVKDIDALVTFISSEEAKFQLVLYCITLNILKI